jgi:hypothetical protein
MAGNPLPDNHSENENGSHDDTDTNCGLHWRSKVNTVATRLLTVGCVFLAADCAELPVIVDVAGEACCDFALRA